MNCEIFHGLLYEYLDETLDAEVKAAAREHLGQCDACRHAFLREQALAKSMRQTLDRATAGLSLRSGMRQSVLRALELKPAPSNAWSRAWQSFISIRIRPAGAAATLLGLLFLFLGVFLGIQYYRQTAKDSDFQTTAQTGHYACVIDVPIQTQTHVFRRQDNTIEDAVASGASIGHAGFFEDSKP
jgi:anti-sigma factor RsiW